MNSIIELLGRIRTMLRTFRAATPVESFCVVVRMVGMLFHYPGNHATIFRQYSQRFGAEAVHIETDDTDGPFNKSRLINRAVAQCAGQVRVITDADAFICD